MAEGARRSRAPTNTVAVWILAVLATLLFLRAARSLMMPIALAVLVAYALAPAVSWLEHHRVHRGLGAALVLLAVLGVTGAAGYTLRNDARAVIEAVPQAAQRARELIAAQIGRRAGAVQQSSEGVGTSGPSEPSSNESTFGDSPGATGSLLERGVTATVGAAGHLVVVFFLVFFLLVSGDAVKRRIVEIAGTDPERRRVVTTIIGDINAQIQRYLLVLLVTAVIVAAATSAVLAMMGVRHAAMWGILAGIFNSIPYFGPVVVSGGLFVVGLVQGGGPSQALQMSGAAIVITSLEGWLITPPLMGKAERMNALAVFIGLLLWTWIWGAWGTLLAVPMLVVVKAVADHVATFRPVGRLLAP
jgi:predicted PurR-regulated permease PerM